RGHRDTDAEYVGKAEHRVERARPAAAPPPDADALRIDERVTRRQRANRRCLVFRRQLANRTVNRFSPRRTARRRGAAIVEADYDIAGLGQGAVEQRVATAPAISHRLAGWLAVDKHD